MNKLRNKYDGILNFIDYKKTGFKFFYIVLIAILVLNIIIGVFPPLWVLLSGFKGPRELFSTVFKLLPEVFDIQKLFMVWSKVGIGKLYLNSLFLVVGAVFCAVMFNGLLAYVISVLKPKGHKVIYIMVLMTMMIPAITNMSTLLANIVKLNVMGSYLPTYIVIWLSYGANAFFFVIFKAYFDRLPKELVEAAQIDGANRFQIFTKLIVPLSLPIIGVVAIFALNASWSDFLLPYLLTRSLSESQQPLMVRIYMINSNLPAGMTYDQLLMMIGLSIIPVLIIFGVFQKQITSNVAETGIK